MGNAIGIKKEEEEGEGDDGMDEDDENFKANSQFKNHMKKVLYWKMYWSLFYIKGNELECL